MHNGQADDQANDRSLEHHETPVSSDSDSGPDSEGARSRPQSSLWRRLWHVLSTPTTDPRFPPNPLQRPLVGYLVALLLQILIGAGVLLLRQDSPTLRLPGILALVAIPVTALIWGTGPSILAAFSGTALFAYLRFSYYFSDAATRPEDIISIFLYLIIGLTISLLASQTQNTRYRATLETNRLHRYYEDLIAQFQAERAARQANEHKLQTREQQLEAILALTTDALFILDPAGAPPQLNEAARDLLGLPPRSEITSTFEQLFNLLDAGGKPLHPRAWPATRLLNGERLSANDTTYGLLRTRTGRMRTVTIAGTPVRDSDNTIIGAVLICHALTAPEREDG